MNKNRQSIRLKNYDYSQSGLYFVTICTGTLPNHHPVSLDIFQIMPNHIHGIIVIESNNVGVSFMKPEIKIMITKSNHHMGLIMVYGRHQPGTPR